MAWNMTFVRCIQEFYQYGNQMGFMLPASVAQVKRSLRRSV